MGNSNTLATSLPESQAIEELKYRQDNLMGNIAQMLFPRPDEHNHGQKMDMKTLGRALGLMVGVAELQALMDVRERGMEAREAILCELDHPPFKRLPVPEGWESPGVNYIRKRLFSNEILPNTEWPL